MRCLMCPCQFEEKNLLLNRYIYDHKINSANCFLKALFKEAKGNFFCRCSAFLKNTLEEKKTKFFITSSKRW